MSDSFEATITQHQLASYKQIPASSPICNQPSSTTTSPDLLSPSNIQQRIPGQPAALRLRARHGLDEGRTANLATRAVWWHSDGGRARAAGVRARDGGGLDDDAVWVHAAGPGVPVGAVGEAGGRGGGVAGVRWRAGLGGGDDGAGDGAEGLGERGAGWEVSMVVSSSGGIGEGVERYIYLVRPAARRRRERLAISTAAMVHSCRQVGKCLGTGQTMIFKQGER